MFSNKKVALAALCITLFGASTAYAQSQVAPSFDDQLALDVTPVPPGSGAIFVPSLSNPKYESKVVVYYQGQKIASGNTGERLVVPPGEYEVAIANGNKDLAARATARVIDGATVVMQPFYGAVRLTAVDEKNNPLNVAFDIEQSGATVVDGLTPTSNEKARTYLLPPGPKTWKFDDGTEIAFDVPVGQFTNYQATFENNQFVGLSHSNGAPIEKKTASKSMWRARLTIGADVSGGYSQDQTVNFNGYYGMLGGFANAEVGLDYGDHLATLKLNIDESWIFVKSKGATEKFDYPLRPFRDKVNLELLYAYRWYRVFGPFVRATVDTAIKGNYIYSPKGAAGCTSPAEPSKNTDIFTGDYCFQELTKPFFPLYAEEAVGVSLTAVDTPTFDLVLLGGVAMRQQYFNPKPKAEIKRAANSKAQVVAKFKEGGSLTDFPDNKWDLFGAMAEARMGLRINRSFRLSLNGKIFVPYQQIPGVQSLAKKTKSGQKGFNPIYNVTGLAEISITHWASFVLRSEVSVPFINTDNYNAKLKPSIYGGGSFRFQTSFF